MNLKKLERYLRVNLLGPGPVLQKKNLPGRGRTKVEKNCFRRFTWTFMALRPCLMMALNQSKASTMYGPIHWALNFLDRPLHTLLSKWSTLTPTFSAICTGLPIVIHFVSGFTFYQPVSCQGTILNLWCVCVYGTAGRPDRTHTHTSQVQNYATKHRPSTRQNICELLRVISVKHSSVLPDDGSHTIRNMSE